MCAKLCDFGLARVRSARNTTIKGDVACGDGELYTPHVVTLWYRAPELLLGSACYGPAVDVWSIGCIFGELLLHEPLLPRSSEIGQISAICELLGTPSTRIWPGVESLPVWGKIQLPNQPYNDLAQRFAKAKPGDAALQLLDALLTYDPRQRITADAAIAHAYINSVAHMPKAERPTSHLRTCVGLSSASPNSSSTNKRPAAGDLHVPLAARSRAAPAAVRVPSPQDVTVAAGRLC